MRFGFWGMRGSIPSPGPRRPEHAALARHVALRMAAIDASVRGVDAPMAG